MKLVILANIRTKTITIKRQNAMMIAILKVFWRIIAILMTIAYRFPIVHAKTGPSVSADLIKCSGIAVIPPRIIAPKTGRTGREGGYRFPSSLTPFCLNRRKRSKAAMTAMNAANTGISPPSNIYEQITLFSQIKRLGYLV